MISILFFGDISGSIGRNAIEKHISELREKYKPDFVIANAENATHGKGLSLNHYKELCEYGIDCLTMGNHLFGVEDVINHSSLYTNMVRPANFHPLVPGVGSREFTLKDGTSIRVTNLLGITAINHPGVDNPFIALENIIKLNKSTLHIVDFHAEATGEKLALAKAFDGLVTAVIGTHTHVQTNDSRLLPLGTAYITDVGACCAYDSILGMEAEPVIYRNSTGMPKRFVVPTTGRSQLNACHIIIANDKAVSITPIFIIN